MTDQQAPCFIVQAVLSSGKDTDPKAVWGFGFKSSVPTCSAWSVCQQSWSNSDGIPGRGSGGGGGGGGVESNQTASPTNDTEDDTIDISQNDSLQSVLQRLELSDYLSNFQVNFNSTVS